RRRRSARRAGRAAVRRARGRGRAALARGRRRRCRAPRDQRRRSGHGVPDVHPLMAAPGAAGSKLRVPRRRRGLVARPALIGALEAARAHRLTVVSAPTGFGKTSALADWAAASPARFAWVALDERDDEPTRFWGHVVAAIEAAAPELPGTAGRRLRGP